ncbi:serine/threonine protein phosphatase [Rhizobium hainanense]|uniref:serine/threonine protein phosphatase n=1 Tax=Rhizobium hainanense TaxID=52131 RepID=UPI001FCE17C8|nr:serine/threonine protein phosphatase [Rhizobium hainanense]
MNDKTAELNFIPNLNGKDIETLLTVLVSGSSRVERVPLSARQVWIKRYGTKRPSAWRLLQAVFSRIVPVAFLRPCAYLSPRQMVERETRRIGLFSREGIAVPEILYASNGTLVLGDAGITVQCRLVQLKESDPIAHDDLMVVCAAELGRLHAKGLCHGRPYPRDMFFVGNRLGFMDFEEDPQTVMPLEVAQARDIWLLFLQIATGAHLGLATQNRAYEAWSEQAPAAARAELQRMIRFLGGFLFLARLIGRVHMGSDLQRFIVATSFLMHAFTTYSVD